LFFIHLESRRVGLAGLTKHPTAEWMIQLATPPTRVPDSYVARATFFMIGIQNSALRF
jgi:hypothetical protein